MTTTTTERLTTKGDDLRRTRDDQVRLRIIEGIPTDDLREFARWWRESQPVRACGQTGELFKGREANAEL